MIDLHCHLLPNVDDGPKTVDESLKMAVIAADEGINKIACTHHFLDENKIIPYLDLLNERMVKFKALLTQERIDIDLYTGAEVHISPFLAEMDGIERLCINNSRYLLVELPMMDIPQYTEDVIYQLRLKGIIPVIAHPERNMRIADNPNLLHSFISLGALAQINTGSIMGKFGREALACAKVLMEHNMGHFIATDSHSPRRRSPVIKKAREIICKWVGEERAIAVSHSIPQAILNDDYLEIDEPVAYKKRLRFFPWHR